jgi:hypothetical protein
MGKSKIILKKNCLTREETTSFLKDFKTACKTMEIALFTNLLTNYDLSFVEDFNEDLSAIYSIISSWNKPELGTELLSTSQFKSKCLFCEFGKTVMVYKWAYQHKHDSYPENLLTYESQIAFYFDLNENQLVKFGVCNGYLDNKEMNLLN